MVETAGATLETARWTAGLRYEDVPERIHERTKAQILSVLGAIHAARYSEAAGALLDAHRSWGGPEEATVFATGERLPRFAGAFANAACSVAFDFDDYLFAGHTCHSAVCTALAYGELVGATGREVLAAATAANETGGRLGAALLFGPHNGQMWAYIHLLGGVCAAGRLLGLDAERTADAIGIAFTQPPYPLIPAFMGPDSKLLIPAQPTVEGARAAEFAARGWRGSKVILEDRQGFLHRFNRDHLGWILSGYGEAWLSDSLTYKVVPGCAYIDTAVDALGEILARFEAKHGRRPEPREIERIHVRCGMYTAGMERFSTSYRDADRIEPITVNFSVALSFGLILTAGELAPRYLSHAHLDAHRDAIEQVAAKVELEHAPEMDARAQEVSGRGGFSLREVLSGGNGGNGGDAATPHKSLSGVSFENYVMAFPVEVTLRTTTGDDFTAASDVPLGAAGRPWEETFGLVRRKFLENYAGDPGKGAEALEAVERLEEVDDVRRIVPLLAP